MSTLRWCFAALLALVTLAVVPTMALGATRTVTVVAEADAQVSNASPNTNFGSTNPIGVDNDGDVESLLRFDVPALASGESLASAKLSLNITNASTNGPNIKRTNPTWTEGSVTNNTRPAKLDDTVDGNFGSVTTGRKETAVIDVTPGVDNSFELSPESTDGMDFNTKEATDSTKRPQLILTINEAETPIGITLNLVNSSGTTIEELTGGETVTDPPAGYDIRAVPSTTVSGIRFTLDGGTPRTEVSAPYTLDNTSDQVPLSLSEGSHTLLAEALDANGVVKGSKTITFSVDDTSNNDTTAPAAPTGLSAAVTDFDVTLNWNDNTEADLNRYTIKRCTDSGMSTGCVDLGSTTVSDKTDTPGVGTWYYTVRAVDNAGNISAASSSASATVQDTTPEPPAPVNLTLNLVNSSGTVIESIETGDTLTDPPTGYDITAVPDASVTNIRFTLDGGTPRVETVSPYTLDDKSVAGDLSLSEGSHTLLAEARDATGAVVGQAQRTFVIDFTGGSSPPAPEGWTNTTQVAYLGFDTSTGCGKGLWSTTLVEGSNTLQFINDPSSAAEGNCFMRVTHPPQSGSSTRAEVALHGSSPGVVDATSGVVQRYVYKFRVNSLAGTMSDGGQVANINQFRFGNTSCYSGGLAINNSRQLVYRVVGGGTNTNCDGATNTAHNVGAPLTDADLGEWIDIKIEAKWSESSDGYLKLWRDGVLRVNHQGATSPTTATVVQFRNGVYARSHTGTISFDYDAVAVHD